MPITKSAAKQMRQNIKHRRRNLRIKSAVKTEIKALTGAIAEGNAKAIAERLSKAQSSLDKAAKAGVIHKNKAARQKSQLTKLIKEGRQKAPKAAAPVKPAEKKEPETPETAKPAKPL